MNWKRSTAAAVVVAVDTRKTWSLVRNLSHTTTTINNIVIIYYCTPAVYSTQIQIKIDQLKVIILLLCKIPKVKSFLKNLFTHDKM